MLQTVENVRATRLFGEFVWLVVRKRELARPRFDFALAVSSQLVSIGQSVRRRAPRPVDGRESRDGHGVDVGFPLVGSEFVPKLLDFLVDLLV